VGKSCTAIAITICLGSALSPPCDKAPGNLAWGNLGAGGGAKEVDVETGTAAARGGDASPL